MNMSEYEWDRMNELNQELIYEHEKIRAEIERLNERIKALEEGHHE